MFVPVTTPPPSPQAQELAVRIADLVRKEGRSNPHIDDADVNEALGLARTMLRSEYPGAGSTRVALIALVLGLLAAVGVGATLYMRKAADMQAAGPDAVPEPGVWSLGIIVAIGVLFVGFAAMFFAKRAR